MTITRRIWNKYIEKLRAINDKAVEEMRAWLAANGTDDADAMVDYAYMCSDYTRIGGEVAYTLKGLFKQTASLFASFGYSHTATDHEMFDKRDMWTAKIGLNF